MMMIVGVYHPFWLQQLLSYVRTTTGSFVLSVIESMGEIVIESGHLRQQGNSNPGRRITMRDLEDLYGPLVTSTDHTGRSPDPAGALVPVD